MKKAAIYCRVATAAERMDSQLSQLRELAKAQGFETVQEYCDRGSSGVKARRPALDSLMADARQHKFDVVLVSGLEKMARSTKHLLQVLDELVSLNIEFVSAREGIDTTSDAGQMFMVACRSISALERSLGGEKIRRGMRRAEYEGQRLGRAPLDVDHASLAHDRLHGMSLTAVAKKYAVSRASVVRWVREHQKQSGVVGGFTVMQQQEAADECVGLIA
jgi:DNA invertase Pin-like site-specific DNA recombinase